MADINEKVEKISSANFFDRPRMTDFGVPKKQVTTNTIKDNSLRLNDYDSNILNEKASWEKEDEKLKPEFMIREKQKEIGDLKKRMKLAEEFDNRQELFALRIKKQRLEAELSELNQTHAKKSITSFGGADLNSPTVHKIKNFISKQILARVSKKFGSMMDISASLEKLSNINKSVDELMTMKVPYGETGQNYEKLTEYLYQANKIRSEITKSIGY